MTAPTKANVVIEVRVGDDGLDRIAELVAERLGIATRAAGAEPWVGVRDAAAHLACKPQRVYDLVHHRDIPHRQVDQGGDHGSLVLREQTERVGVEVGGDPVPVRGA